MKKSILAVACVLLCGFVALTGCKQEADGFSLPKTGTEIGYLTGTEWKKGDSTLKFNNGGKVSFSTKVDGKTYSLSNGYYDGEEISGTVKVDGKDMPVTVTVKQTDYQTIELTGGWSMVDGAYKLQNMLTGDKLKGKTVKDSYGRKTAEIKDGVIYTYEDGERTTYKYSVQNSSDKYGSKDSILVWAPSIYKDIEEAKKDNGTTPVVGYPKCTVPLADPSGEEAPYTYALDSSFSEGYVPMANWF